MILKRPFFSPRIHRFINVNACNVVTRSALSIFDKRVWFFIAALLPCACLVGCRTNTKAAESELRLKGHVEGLLDSTEWTKALASSNADILVTQFKEEWKYNRAGQTTEPPQLGLALSGGGMRSATFSIGVMHGLSDMGLMDRLDLMSSVSGGGYAASWYYVQNTPTPENQSELFDTNGVYQTYIEQHGELIGHSSASATWSRRPQYLLINVPETILSWPVNLFFNGLFGWHANVVPIRHTYEAGIDKIFHKKINDNGNATNVHIAFDDLAAALPGNLPFPIVNTTAHIEDAVDFQVSPLKNRVFEFTPLRFGSEYFGYAKSEFPFDYNRAIAVSGAAVDTTYLKATRGSTRRMVASALNFDLGYFINNPKVDDKARWKTRLSPFPIYAFSGSYQRDKRGGRIYLADGGHSENLATYALVRRLCRSIIIVDAGYDPELKFADYRLLKNALRTEMGVDFSVPKIDSGEFNTNNQNCPIMPGTISYFPLQKRDKIEPLQLHVAYIKLSMDNQHLEKYPHAVKDFYQSTLKNKAINLFGLHFGESSVFPHQSTLDQSYYPDQIIAYHELGRIIIHDNREVLLTALGLK